jgi:hypothetical protein
VAPFAGLLHWGRLGLLLASLRDHPNSLAPAPMDVFVRGIVEQNNSKSVKSPIFTTAPSCSRIVFLDDRTGVSGMCGELTILDISGEVLFHREFEKVLTGGITGCRNCDVAVSGILS